MGATVSLFPHHGSPHFVALRSFFPLPRNQCPLLPTRKGEDSDYYPAVGGGGGGVWSKEGWEFPGHWTFRNCLKIIFKGKSESEDSPNQTLGGDPFLAWKEP